jgi:hypothetical protein
MRREPPANISQRETAKRSSGTTIPNRAMKRPGPDGAIATDSRARTMSAEQIALIEKHNAIAAREPEPEAPAAGPVEQMSAVTDQRSERLESVSDIRSERWPKIDIDESLRILAFPPRSLRVR